MEKKILNWMKDEEDFTFLIKDISKAENTYILMTTFGVEFRFYLEEVKGFTELNALLKSEIVWNRDIIIGYTKNGLNVTSFLPEAIPEDLTDQLFALEETNDETRKYIDDIYMDHILDNQQLLKKIENLPKSPNSKKIDDIQVPIIIKKVSGSTWITCRTFINKELLPTYVFMEILRELYAILEEIERKESEGQNEEVEEDEDEVEEFQTIVTPLPKKVEKIEEDEDENLEEVKQQLFNTFSPASPQHKGKEKKKKKNKEKKKSKVSSKHPILNHDPNRKQTIMQLGTELQQKAGELKTRKDEEEKYRKHKRDEYAKKQVFNNLASSLQSKKEDEVLSLPFAGNNEKPEIDKQVKISPTKTEESGEIIELPYGSRIVCPNCKNEDKNRCYELEDRERPVSYHPQVIYAKKYKCKICGTVWRNALS